MTRQIEIVDHEPEVVDDVFPTAPILVHRQDIANIIRAMLMTSPNRDFSAGIIAVGAALGVEVRR